MTDSVNAHLNTLPAMLSGGEASGRSMAAPVLTATRFFTAVQNGQRLYYSMIRRVDGRFMRRSFRIVSNGAAATAMIPRTDAVTRF